MVRQGFTWRERTDVCAGAYWRDALVAGWGLWLCRGRLTGFDQLRLCDGVVCDGSPLCVRAWVISRVIEGTGWVFWRAGGAGERKCVAVVALGTMNSAYRTGSPLIAAGAFPFGYLARL